MKIPFLKFYTSDWRSDPALRMCSAGARGLWIEMLCIMHEAHPRGDLLVNGKNVTTEDLSKLASIPLEETEKYLLELEDKGVFSRRKNKIIYSRRIEKDENKARKNRENGKIGGNPTLTNHSENQPSDNPEVKAHGRKPESRSQTPEVRKKDTELGARVGAMDLAKLETDLREAAGWQSETHPNLSVTGPIAELLLTGHDWELDIAPIVRSRCASVRRRTSWNYFIDAIKDAKLDRENARTPSTSQRTGALNGKNHQPTDSNFTRAANKIRDTIDREIAETEEAIRRERGGN